MATHYKKDHPPHSIKGFLFAAVGEKYVEESVQSAASIREHLPQVSITLITNQHFELPVFDQVRIIELPEPGLKGVKLYKPLALAETPYHKTVFLDSDTYICADCSELFDMMDYVELLLAHDTADMSKPLIDGRPMGFHPYNSGLLAFQITDRIKHFLTDWYRCLDRDFADHPWDQRAMMSSILKHRIQTYTLHPIYNCRTNFIVSLPQVPVKIIHGRDIDMKSVPNRLNRVAKNRVWMPRRQKVWTKRRPNQFWRFLRKAWEKMKFFREKKKFSRDD